MRQRISRVFQMACLCGVSLAAVAANGQITAESATTERIEDRTYHFAEASVDLPYSLFVPSTYDGSKAYPLVVALHGLGSTSDQIIRYRGMTDLAEQHGYIVAAPMGYNNHGWYGSLGTGKNRFSERFERGVPAPENLGELSEKDVLNVLDIVRKEFTIDPNRIFLMGHSMGGGGTLFLGMKHRQLWAGLGAVAPAIYSSPDQLSAIAKMPIIIVQGDQDRLVRVEVTRRWAEKMQELGMPHRYIEVAGGDHIRVAPDHLPDIFAFFNQHSRRE